MDQVQDPRPSRASNQSWRKKPRKFAPKSRLGCRTCKIRRIKCDLSRPSCQKCQSTGRTCDGYDEVTSLKPEGNTEPGFPFDRVLEADSCDTLQSCRRVNYFQSEKLRWHIEERCSLNLRSPRSFMTLPLTSLAQIEAMKFFEHVSIDHLNKYQLDSDSWRRTLMFFSQTVPAVRHAAIALGSLHRSYFTRDYDSIDSTHMQRKGSWKAMWPLDKEAPLLHYALAIQFLLRYDSVGHDSTEKVVITLLVCYIFTCFDHLVGDDLQAMQHLRGGVALSRNLDNTQRRLKNYGFDQPHANSSEISTLVLQLTSQIRRLDMQCITYLLDWVPEDIQETNTWQALPPGGAFQSLDHAADHLQLLIARILRLCNAEEQMYPTGKVAPVLSPSHLKDVLLGHLDMWLGCFESLLQLQKIGPSFQTIECVVNPLVKLLRLQYSVAWIFLSSHGPGREMEYDAFLPQFQHCVDLASDVMAAYEHHSGSLHPTFTPEIKILPVLYIIGAKCRHPVVRREVVSILQRQVIREAVWNSIITARMLQRIIEIEESGTQEGIVMHGMHQIAVWQRIEAMSWTYKTMRNGIAGLDVTYTFCTREGVHTEHILV